MIFIVLGSFPGEINPNISPAALYLFLNSMRLEREIPGSQMNHPLNLEHYHVIGTVKHASMKKLSLYLGTS